MAELSIRECVEALRPVAAQARAAARLSEVLDSLASIENHRDELVAEVQLKLAAVDEAEKRSAEVASWVIEETEKIAAEASATRGLIANERVAVLEEARREANALVEAAKIAVAELGEKSLVIEARIADLTAEVADLQTLVNRRDDLLAEIAALREKVALL